MHSTPTKSQRARLLAFTFVMAAGTAHADWQYTKWGMAPNEAITASGGALEAVTGEKTPMPDGSKLEVRGSYEAAGRRFRVVLWFAPSGLSMVLLAQTNPGECSDTFAALAQKYGAPVSSTGPSSVSAWSDKASGNSIAYRALERRSGSETACTITYTPVGVDAGL